MMNETFGISVPMCACFIARMYFYAFQLVNGLDVPRYMCEMMENVNVAPAAAVMEYTTSGNHTSKNANGNIITLTLKNNHLIVETEERAVRAERRVQLLRNFVIIQESSYLFLIFF